MGDEHERVVLSDGPREQPPILPADKELHAFEGSFAPIMPLGYAYDVDGTLFHDSARFPSLSVA